MDTTTIQNQINDILSKPTDAPMSDYFQEASDVYDEFNTYSHSIGKGYSCPDFPFFDQKMEGLLPGLYLFAARSNAGKTALMTNLLWSYCNNPDNHLFGIYYSLDDSCHDVVPRMMSMLQQIPISVCAKPQRYEEEIQRLQESTSGDDQRKADTYRLYLGKRDDALLQLKQASNHFYIVDSSTIDCIEKLESHARKVQTYVKSLNPKNNIIIGIDSIFDLTFSSSHFKTRDDESRAISHRMKQLYENLNIPIFGSCHLRKTNDRKNNRPVKDDLKDSGRLQYDASVIFMIYNDVSENKQNASVYYDTAPNIKPVLEIDWSKNKRSSYKDMSYCYFQPEYSRVQECSEQDMQRFDQIRFQR